MTITNDQELRAAARKAGDLLQDIQNYCGQEVKEDAKVRFPRGYLRTASSQRSRLGFVADEDLKSNLAYTLILSDSVLWQLTKTDIAATAKEMLIKLFIFIGGTLIESITKDYLKGLCGQNFKKRTQYLVDHGVIDTDLQLDIDWIWNTRNNMHLFMLDSKEYDNDYNTQSQVKCAKAFKQLIENLKAKGRLQTS
jgi:hypothetical protein